MRLTRRVARIESVLIPPPPQPVRLSPEQRRRAHEILQRMWHNQDQWKEEIEFFRKLRRERGEDNTPNESWFRME